ncbi:MAG: glycogen/starch synthase [bacterium]|jgi:starch synthase
MAKTKILFITHEMSPFLELSKIAKITRQLPQAMQEKGFEIRILMPRFGSINERRNRLHEVIRLSGMNIVINDNDNPLIIKVASLPSARMQVYFLDNEEYFQRKTIFRDAKENFHADNDERMIFFCKGAIETVKKLGWMPDVVHCFGWMTSLVPMYLKTSYKEDPMFKNTRVVYSVYENCFTESLDKNLKTKSLMPEMDASQTSLLKDSTCSALHINAINYSDAVVKADENIDNAVIKFLSKQSDKTIIENYNHDEIDFDTFVTFYEEVSEELVTV